MNLHNKRILITGAAHGLGRELALLLEREGAPLILVDQDTQGIVSYMGFLVNPMYAFTSDLSNLVERKKLIEDIKTDVKVDILINCAGIGSHSRLDQLEVDEIEHVMQVNTLAALELTAGLSPLELVVNIGSVAGEMNLPSMSLYAASKSALHAFTRSLSFEGVRTLLVILGPLRGTDFIQSIAHPRTGQPKWHRNLDLDVKIAARAIVRAMKRGRSRIVLPWWYRVVIFVSNIATPFIKLFKSV